MRFKFPSYKKVQENLNLESVVYVDIVNPLHDGFRVEHLKVHPE